MIAYDPDFDPPALVLEAVVAGAAHSRPRVRIPTLIDTGTDVTAIPSELVNHLRLYPLNRIAITGVGAEETIFYIYAVRLTVTALGTREMEVIPTTLPFAILGRDWLQDYYLLLEGPRKQFQLSSHPLT